MGQPHPLCASSLTNIGPMLQEKALHPHHCPSSLFHPAEVEENTSELEIRSKERNQGCGKESSFSWQLFEGATCLHNLVLWVDQLHLRNADVHSGPSLLCLESSTYKYTHTLNTRGKWCLFKVFLIANICFYLWVFDSSALRSYNKKAFFKDNSLLVAIS